MRIQPIIHRLMSGLLVMLLLAQAVHAQDATPTTAYTNLEDEGILVLIASSDQQNEPTTQKLHDQFISANQVVMDDQTLDTLPINIRQSDVVINNAKEAEALANEDHANLVIWSTSSSQALNVHLNFIHRWGLQTDTLLSPQIAVLPFETFELVMRFEENINQDYLSNAVLGLSYYLLIEYEPALSFFENALEKINAQSDLIQRQYGADVLWFFVGTIREAEFNDVVGAAAAYTQSIILNNDSISSYNGRGRTYAKQGKLNDAIDDFSQAIVIDPQYTTAYIQRGLAYYDQSEFDKAIDDFTTAINLSPESWYGFADRAVTLYAQGNYEEALIDFDQALELNPDYGEGYYSRCITYYALEQVDEALEDCVEASSRAPEYANTFWVLGNLYYDRRLYAEALESYQYYLELAGDQDAEFIIQRIKEIKSFLGTM